MFISASFIFTNCSKKDPLGIFDSLEAIECVSKIQKIQDDDDLTCEEIGNKLNEIEKSCKDYLSDDSKANIALLRANCTNS